MTDGVHDSESERLARVVARLQNPPSISLPTDYPRPPGTRAVVEAEHVVTLSEQAATALLKLALYSDADAGGADDDDDDGASTTAAAAPSAFHLLLAAFAVLLHRYTGDSDLLLGASSARAAHPLLLRLAVDPADPFWAVVRNVQQASRDAEADAVPLAALEAALGRGGAADDAHAPLARVRFSDATDGAHAALVRGTALTTDLSIAVSRAAAAAASTHAALAPQIELRIRYNSLLFQPARIATLVAQLQALLRRAATDPLAPAGSVPLGTPAQARVLPDPAADLDWCGWAGAIPDVFSRNARAHPDRPCVVQSYPATELGGSQATRTYTYGAIRAAANTLAHVLLAGGVQREEVVMVYAHRSVELVVAVMAVLKAGATFSVIDPAYPPSRQNIYLSVARPRALVVLKGAGKIAASVREFMDAELELRVEVPALEILPDGAVRGGAAPDAADADVLDVARARADMDPDVVLGPDSVGTLSFTSGSTGVPKGVRGRHFSLTHFFPWMGTRFGLGAHSRFTMLSGIAHDPIQRDMFTPLFFGAQLHVPTADDIGTPGRLAEWMAASQVTVTHLTPAMGQLLSAQASAQIPTLSAAFFVGDVLTKRDVLRLQALAAHCTVVNMYGTTETQRAVSYFALPPAAQDATFLATQKDVIPAGQGMKDVQLLVVNRHARAVPCAVGELGELYVRSGGLAEGYSDAAATAEKFVPNWFAAGKEWPDTVAGTPAGAHWRGVRDRMYRSGDLGRYRPDGSVECAGRADDQVKIRGFRIELGEVDTLLAQHPLVRENVTLVRRDKDEEKILVSYFVPLQGAADGLESEGVDEDEGKGVVGGIRRWRRLIKDIREHLKKKLPAYSVPTLFVPLHRMPLNPNGKIDKPALPFPDTAQAAAAEHPRAAAPRTTSATEEAMQAIWARVLPSAPSPVPADTSFFDLGGHSILATRLIFEVRKTFVLDAPLGLVFERPTLAGLAAAVDELRNADLGLAYPGPERDARADGLAPPGAQRAHAQDARAAEYASDLDALLPRLRARYDAPAPDDGARALRLFLTGATGFLGAFVLRDLLAQARVAQVVCLVRAKDAGAALARLRELSGDRGAWEDAWVADGRVRVVCGDLNLPKFGLSDEEWSGVAQEADVVLHNGALVHWVYPYDKLRPANVLGTLTALELAADTKPKALVFVSSTSALDTAHYVRVSDERSGRPEAERGVPEDDDLEGARDTLKTGYGQTKWVAEKLLFEAGRRGLKGYIMRPGYIVGESQSAVTNTDDFIWRLVKGCIQLGLVPDIHNGVNMVPVDHVSRALCAAALYAPSAGMEVLHMTAHPLPTFNGVLGALHAFGYATERAEYVLWRRRLEQHVLAAQDNALFPLLHFVLDDLPTSTKAPELNDARTAALLARHGLPAHATVDEDLMGKYVAWLVGAGFLPPPTMEQPERPLPVLDGAAARAVGRSGV